MEDENIVLSYKNSLLYEDDVSVLEQGRWINDSVFGFVFEYFAHKQFKAISEDICFIAPAVSQFLKLCQGRTREDISDFLEDLELQSKKYIIVAVNDSMLHDRIGGSHWSTMVYSKEHERIFYFDSLGSRNLKHAKEIQRKIGLHFQAFQDATFDIVSCPQQENGTDCGLYAICFAEEVCNGVLKNRPDFYNVYFTSDHAFEMRQRIKNVISELAQGYDSDDD